MVAGGIAFGFEDIQTPVGVTLGQGEGMLRLAGMLGYLAVHLLVVGTLAFWFSTITDAPLAAVGGAVFTMFVFAILDQVEQLGAIRDWFPTAEEFAWTDLLQTPVDSGDLFRGVIQSLVYAAIFTALAFRHFARRDVTVSGVDDGLRPRDRLGPALAHRGVGDARRSGRRRAGSAMPSTAAPFAVIHSRPTAGAISRSLTLSPIATASAG